VRGDSSELRARVTAIVKDMSRENWMSLQFADLGDEAAAEVAAVAVRRWLSFDRRARGPRADRVQDLAKGLRTALTRDDPDFLDGEPMYRQDWVRMAERIAVAFRED
jgi:hypothetical protein